MKIKERIDLINSTIKILKKEKVFVQDKVCKHPKTFEGWWSDYPGHRYWAKICSDCGKSLEVL